MKLYQKQINNLLFKYKLYILKLFNYNISLIYYNIYYNISNKYFFLKKYIYINKTRRRVKFSMRATMRGRMRKGLEFHVQFIRAINESIVKSFFFRRLTEMLVSPRLCISFDSSLPPPPPPTPTGSGTSFSLPVRQRTEVRCFS